MQLLFLGLGLMLANGVAAVSVSRAPRLASCFGVFGVVSGCVAIGAGVLGAMSSGQTLSWSNSWDAAHGAIHVEVDALSAFFLAPVLILSALAAVYGGPCMARHPRSKKLGGHWFFFQFFVVGMVGVLIARTVVLFLVSWEVMSVAAYGLVTFEHEELEVRRAGWIYLIAAHLGVACILAAFLLLANRSGSLDFHAMGQHQTLSAVFAAIVFLLALAGFGAKAGFVPMHVWLPEAYSAAPPHVAGAMSGAMAKMGIYGLLRVMTMLGAPQPWWGICLAVLGLGTAVFGIAMSLMQKDLKRVLAYSSIENMGLIALSLGIGIWGWAVGQPANSVLGFSAALLHVWNHAAMKGLTFMATGSLLGATGTTNLERLGGLMKRMPWTGCSMLLGAVAIAALPPLNGFVGKWLLYLGMAKIGLMQSDVLGVGTLLATGVVAAVGGLAAVSFVRLVGIAFLGAPRSPPADAARESPWCMVVPLVILAALCVGLSLAPQQFVPYPKTVVHDITAGAIDDESAWTSVAERLSMLGVMNAIVWVCLIAASGALGALLRRDGVASAKTWSCGYVAPVSRMQYTGASFSELLGSRLLPRFLRPRIARSPLADLFPTSGSFSTSCTDPVTRDVFEPFFARWAERFAKLRFLQQGKMYVYLLYVFVVVIIGLSWVALRSWLHML